MTDKNPEKIREMFDLIADSYDFINNIISFGTHKRGKKLAVKNLEIPEGLKILDLCTGTGDLAYFLSKRGRVTGLDFSSKMLAVARKKVPDAEFIEGDCTNLPFNNASFDVVTIGFGLRNIENSDRAIEEICRVLKPDGIFMHLDFSNANPFGDFVFEKFVPLLVKIFYGNTVPYKYLVQSKQEYFNPQKLKEKFESHGLKYVTQKFYALNMMCETVMKR